MTKPWEEFQSKGPWTEFQQQQAPVVEKLPQTVDEIRSEVQKIRSRYTEETGGLAPGVTAPVEGTGGAAFGVFAVQGKQRRENIEKAREQQKAQEIPYETLVNDDKLFGRINNYMVAVGEKPFNPEKETRKQYVDKFYTERRWAEFNTVFGTVPELANLMNADEARRIAIAEGRTIYKRAEDNPNKLGAVKDIGLATVTDPTNVLGFGAGKAVSSAIVRGGVKALTPDVALRPAAKAALSARAKRGEIIASAATESAVGAAADITSQRAEEETARIMGEDYEFNKAGLAFATLLPGVISGAVSAKTTKAPVIRERGEIIGDELVRRQEEIAKKQLTQVANNPQKQEPIVQALTTDFDAVHSQYVKAYGKSLLQQVDPAAAATDAKVQEQYSRSAVKMALELMKDRPDQFGWNPATEQISDAIYRTFSQIEQVDDVALESAISRAGLRPDQFAAMTKTTVTEAAQIMQAYSVASRTMKRLREINPGFDKQMKELYSVDNESVSGLSKFGSAVQRVERESKAIITSGIDTLARNLIGNNIGLTLKAGIDLIEGARYSVGTALSAADGTKMATLKTTMSDAFKDSIGTYYYLTRSGLSEDITEKVLANNPTLLSRISSATQDTDLNDVSPLARWAQTLNSAMDGMYRRASFVGSLETELRRVGIDLYADVLAQNKEIPTSILKKALDDSFKDTFSYTPKMYAKSFSAFEDRFERIGAQFVRVAEAPGMSLAIPFPRFITNAIAFQYKYSPLGFVGAVDYAKQAAKLRRTADELANAPNATKADKDRASAQLMKAEMVAREGATKAIQATVGFGMLAAAYDYRVNNPDKPWYQLGDVDVRAIFPLSPYLGLADWFARDIFGGSGNAPTKEIAENIMGFKMPAGSQNSFLTTIQEMVGSEEKWDKLVEGLGKMAGDFLGRFTQPFVAKQIFDLFDLIRGNEAVMARDPNLITADTTTERAAQAAIQRVQAKLPVAKESLPEAVVRFKDQETPSKEGEFFNRIVGFRTIANPTEAEKEINKHSTDLYKVYGRPSGDRDFDRMYISKTNKFALDNVDEVIRRPDYKESTSEEKKMSIDNAIRDAVENAKKDTEGYFEENFPDKMSRIRYLELPSEKKKVVNQRYAKDHGGRTMEEDKAYDKLPLYSDFGNVKFATGGVVQQMDSLFGR